MAKRVSGARVDNGEEVDELVEKVSRGRISYVASRITQGTHRFYTLTMPSDVLVDTCTVDRRIENPIIGFQRRLDIRRAQQIADYIDSGLGTIPGSIILSAQPAAELKFSVNSTLSFNKIQRAFLILDGQHRVFGFHQTKRVKRLPPSGCCGPQSRLGVCAWPRNARRTAADARAMVRRGSVQARFVGNETLCMGATNRFQRGVLAAHWHECWRGRLPCRLWCHPQMISVRT